MIHGRPWLPLILALALLSTTGSAAAEVPAAAPDGAVPNGYQFTQAGPYSVTDDDQARFWSEFQRLGGVGRLGYPVSDRLSYKGFTTQVFQKLAMQWRPEQNRAVFVNLFDELNLAGKDGWLFTVRSTPKPVQIDEQGKGWADVVAGRLALLDANPAIRDAYRGSANWLDDFGLPTSRVEDLGPLYALRTQRVVFQQWKSETPWAKAGQVVISNGGDVAKEAGLFPTSALTQQVKYEVAPTGPPELQQINRYRAAAGAPPISINPSLARAAESHVAYYDANAGDPALAGMGLHQETSGKPGFTGATMGDRARAASYTAGTVTENAGYGSMESAIEWYMDTINHRLPLIHPSALDIGYSVSPSSRFSIIDMGLRRDALSVPLPSVYPGPGATDVPTSWAAAESPDPAPGLPRPLGYPITVAFGVTQKVDWKSLSLVGPDGVPLPVTVARTDWMRAAAIIPNSPLQPGTSYAARIDAVADGKPVTKEWTFTTR